MPDGHDVLERVLRGEPQDWLEIVAAMEEVVKEHTPKSVDLIRRLLAWHGDVVLTDESEAPHAMPPNETLHSQALQALGRWATEDAGHLDTIAEFADSTHSQTLHTIARSHLPPERR